MLTIPTLNGRINDLRQLCRRVTRVVSSTSLLGYRLAVHDMHPHLLPVGYVGREHVHSYYEAHIVLDGQALYTMGTPQELRPGSTLLHGPHMPHTWQASEGECLRMLFWFSVDPLLPVRPEQQWPIWPEVLWDLTLLLHEAEESVHGWEQRATARISIILSRLLTLADWPQRDIPRQQPTELTLVDVVEQFLHDNLDRPLALEDVSAHTGLSTRTLCRQFQAHTGVSVMEHLLTLRMDRAAALLADTSAPLAEIALQVGLPDPSYFCRRFRKHFHTSPKKYREQIREGMG